MNHVKPISSKVETNQSKGKEKESENHSFMSPISIAFSSSSSNLKTWQWKAERLVSLRKFIMKNFSENNEWLEYLTQLQYEEYFEEADCIHLVQIFLTVTENKANLFRAFIYWFKILKESLGDKVFLLVSNPQSYSSQSTLKQMVRLAQQLIQIDEQFEELKTELILFYECTIELSTLLDKLEIVKKQIEAKKFPEKNLDELLEDFKGLNKQSRVLYPLSNDILQNIKEEYEALCKIASSKIEGLSIPELIALLQKFNT